MALAASSALVSAAAHQRQRRASRHRHEKRNNNSRHPLGARRLVNIGMTLSAYRRSSRQHHQRNRARHRHRVGAQLASAASLAQWRRSLIGSALGGSSAASARLIGAAAAASAAAARRRDEVNERRHNVGNDKQACVANQRARACCAKWKQTNQWLGVWRERSLAAAALINRSAHHHRSRIALGLGSSARSKAALSGGGARSSLGGSLWRRCRWRRSWRPVENSASAQRNGGSGALISKRRPQRRRRRQCRHRLVGGSSA